MARIVTLHSTIIRNALGFCAIIILLVTLAGCSTSRKDGPPNFYVDESRIPNAVPKKEPLAKYGNMSSYRVKGRRYCILKSAKHFEQTGIASWYGTKFHSRRTSSGERYNMLAMTAAHKTLPLPTYVEVTNLKNHRQIIVKVNDRGPFSSNRIIDLSYVAAKKLGMMGRGTAYVRVRALDPATAYANKATTTHSKARNAVTFTASKKQFFLHAGEFSNKTRAINFKNSLAKLNFPVRLTLPTANSQLYSVQVGPLRDIASVNKISRRLKAMGIAADKIQEV